MEASMTDDRCYLEFAVDRLGDCAFESPMKGVRFISEKDHVLYHSSMEDIQPYLDSDRGPPCFEMAGPRQKIYFDPAKVKVGIVTCGGLCPGLNDVIRAVVLSLYHHYGVHEVFGFRFGYEGLVKKHDHTPMKLTPDVVNEIHNQGGTILGSSRGPQDVPEMVDTLQEVEVGILFVVGGDGTLKGGHAIWEEANRRGLRIAVIGIPKTIDNDISLVQTSFGFDTAVSEARRSIYSAYTEAAGGRNGIGLVKLMGRESGFIAAFSALANDVVNFCLVPEVPFTVEAFLKALNDRLSEKGYAVIVAAEGAGQDLFEELGEKDKSGNVKYINPSYLIRSMPANARDSAFCLLLGQNAVHAGMAGRTNMVVGFWKNEFTHVPIPPAVAQRKRIDPQSWLWSAVLAATRQPVMQ
jgi:6-phosphofructokinase 1